MERSTILLLGKSTISMAIFQFANCKRLPDGTPIFGNPHSCSMKSWVDRRSFHLTGPWPLIKEHFPDFSGWRQKNRWHWKKMVYEESGKWKSGLKLIKSVIKRRSMKKPMAFLLGAELSNVLEVTHILTRSQTNVRLSHSCRNKHSHLRILKNPKQTLKKNESMVFPGFFTKLVRETSQPRNLQQRSETPNYTNGNY